MKTADIVRSLGLKVIAGENGMDREVTGGYVSDLLSDVIGSAREGNIWITLQTHLNIIAVASLKDLAGIILVKDLKADNDTIEKGNIEGIPVLSSEEDSFTVAGKLFELMGRK